MLTTIKNKFGITVELVKQERYCWGRAAFGRKGEAASPARNVSRSVQSRGQLEFKTIKKGHRVLGY